MASTAPLVVEDLALRRGGLEVLRGLSAAFETGRVTAVVGPSGAGKTSLLRCLNRLEEATDGRVLLDGRDVRTLPPTDLRRRVGMIFQTPVLLERTVRADLGYGLDGIDDRALRDALEVSGLDPAFLERRSSALSVGQAQRVCIARALVREPEVLLMDEPTSALDKDASARIEALIRSLSARSLAIVLVTHDLAQAQRVADWAFLLVEGRFVASGVPDEVTGAWEEAVSEI
ncbi:MAG: phosphate ABC transporter ATP-binding protein [Actinomycetota bacterium]